MPDPVKEKDLFELVKTFQLHQHAKNIATRSVGFTLEDSFTSDNCSRPSTKQHTRRNLDLKKK